MSDSDQKVMVVGAAGMLGCELVALLKTRQQQVVQAVWPPTDDDRQYDLDITDVSAVYELINRIHPRVVYNCSAYTDVDAAEEQEELASAVNGAGVGHLAHTCRRLDSLLVHVSTDYVFDGQAQTPYKPGDRTAPRSAYGRSKLAGEEAVRLLAGKWLIVRTSWLFGRAGLNFVDNILALARERSGLKVVDDQIGCPTYAPHLARCLVDLANKNVTGIYHFCNAPPCSWFDLAREAIEIAGIDCQVTPCPSSEFPRPAPRPPYSVLDCADTFARLGWTARSWKQALSEHLSR